MALILPKGIVVNSDQINDSIQSIALEPLDAAEIAKFWKVYTTTKRRLLDPTAERLENYWWRIWHSDRQYLDAATIARLFAHISDGPTFMPLRGPPNRHEGPSPPNRSMHQHRPGTSSTTALQQPPPSGPSIGTTTTARSKAPVPMPHPILKKTRGPSTGGPRPTARFISPHESEHEKEDTSPASPISHVAMQPPSPDPKDAKPDKKPLGTGSKKKAGFMASKKKRPVIVRRQSSLSSADAAAKEAEASQAAVGFPSSLDPPPKNSGRIQSKFQENFSPPPERFRGPKKRLGELKRTSPRKPASGKGRAAPHQRLSEGTVATPGGDPGPSTQLCRIENRQSAEEVPEEPTPEELEEVEEEVEEELEMQRILLAEANARVQKRRPKPGPESSEHMQSKSVRSKSAGNLGLMCNDHKGSPSLAPSLAAATGLVLGTSPSGPRDIQRSTRRIPEGKGKGKEIEDDEAGPLEDVFARIPVPRAKSTSGVEALSRSKSQLTLLLKRDEEKASRNSEKHGNDKGKGKLW
ncbi:uncharacterized protein L3040_008193 [Drepanopeziza brunnea f. sp. 'multigermtubi']|nr:hypothetical protein L3040_008193 [Drepanopeziza brunnea f. sp. 'multigermtubi']